EDLSHLTRDVIVIAHDMLPSQTAALDKLHVKGFATDVGGRTSHTAIVARAMGIPAVVGLGDITGEVSGGDTVIIDGNRGVMIINPDTEQLEEHRELEKKQVRLEAELKTLAQLPARTTDKHEVSLWANIEFPKNIDGALARSATRSWATARSACACMTSRCSSVSSAPSFAPVHWAMCASCSR